MKTYRITNIDWDTDRQEIDLPTDFLISVDIKEGATELEIEERLGELVSDEYGYLHFGFDYKEEPMKTYISVIKIEWVGNKEYAESKQHYIDKVIKQFYDDYNIELSPNEITQIEEVK